ncbi:flavodoxin [Pseudoflavonifractor sp. 524-17]|uniref:flavodoxin family protein n=1 Tax=Pseudoflavonifractor sp. 524-17 TaxID=2304577 RepID=UPI001379E251|nr:NAD(P)H-dependent oxidoreductase [Pseudoflavonifractor sp. 524-17]NCE65815.1 flavodoxin [Pseudoflavonifractor sp. 524-17]
MKLSVLYYSKSGNTKRMARAIGAGAQSVEGVEVGVFPLERVDQEFVKESACVLLGTPAYLASMAGTVKNWLEIQARSCSLAGKLGGAFATADYVHGGGDMAVQGILTHFMVLGMVVYSGGGSWGKPYIHLGPVAISEELERYRPIFTAYGERMAKKSKELFG